MKPAKGSAPFEVGDKVRVVAFGQAKAGDIYTVLGVSETHIRAVAEHGSATVCYLREKFVHA